MNGAVFLEGENITLRTIEEDDLEFITRNFNDPNVREGLSYYYPQNLEQEKKFFEDVICADENKNMAIYNDDGQIMGVGGLESTENGETASLGIWIAAKFHGNGYGTEASKLMTDYAFDELRFHKVYARAFEFNEGSQRIWEKLDFEKEGTLREHVYKNGDYQDVYMYGITEEAWT